MQLASPSWSSRLLSPHTRLQRSSRLSPSAERFRSFAIQRPRDDADGPPTITFRFALFYSYPDGWPCSIPLDSCFAYPSTRPAAHSERLWFNDLTCRHSYAAFEASYSSSLEPSDDPYPVMHMHMRGASEPPATRMASTHRTGGLAFTSLLLMMNAITHQYLQHLPRPREPQSCHVMSSRATLQPSRHQSGLAARS